MQETVTYVVMFVIVVIIIGIGITMLSTVQETSTIETRQIDRQNATIGAITGGPSWFGTSYTGCSSGTTSIIEVSPSWSNATGSYKYLCISGYPHWTGERAVRHATNDPPVYPSTCAGVPRTNPAVVVNQTPQPTNKLPGGGSYVAHLVKKMVDSERVPYQCGGIYADEWAEVMKAYTDQSQSSYALLIIITIVIAAVVILFVLRYLY